VEYYHITVKAGTAILGTLLAGWTLAPEPFDSIQPGVPFRLLNAMTPEKHQIETMPGGVATLDFDNDGRLDLFFINGAPQPSLRKSGPEWWNRLYRNLGGWKFEDVTEKAGLRGEGYGMSATAGDFDNDGFTDLLVTGVGFNTLYRNRGGGAFEDVTRKAGIRPTGWSIGAAWFDSDNDGDLDLFIVNYCVWNPATEPFCGDRVAGYRTYCHPKYYDGLPNHLYRNNGDGTFTDISREAGLAGMLGKGMAAAVADYNNDGRMDLFVTNDTAPNFLFRNEGGNRFTEVGLEAGVASVDDGKVLSSMGAGFEDIDGDGRPDIFHTALTNETFPLFRNLGNGLFQEVTYKSRIGAASLQHSGWSFGIFDFDNDGWKDIFVANGDVQDNTEIYSSRRSKQQNQLFRNKGDGTFESLLFGPARQHRGTAFGDFDGDGLIDAAVTTLDGPVELWRNRIGEGRAWIGLALQGTRSNRDAIGAKVRLSAGGRVRHAHVSPYTGYLGTHTKTLYFGLAGNAKADWIEILWPSGATQRIENAAAGKVHRITEPQDAAAPGRATAPRPGGSGPSPKP
jgi:hypothetical protein